MDNLIIKLLNEFDRTNYDLDHTDDKYHDRYEGLAEMIDEIEQYYHYSDEQYSLKLFKDALMWAFAWEDKDGDCSLLIDYLHECIEYMQR